MSTSDIVTNSISPGRSVGSAPFANGRPPARRPRPYALALLVGVLSIASTGTLRSSEDRSSATGEPPVPAAAPRPVDVDTVRQLMRWIGENTGYRTEDVTPPRVVTLTAESLTRELYAEAAGQAPADGIDERVLGLYAAGDGASGTVYVLGCRDEDARAAALEPCTGDPLFLERLLHELVHHVQHAAGADAFDPCRRTAEEEAYRLGGRFLRAHHAEDPLPNRAFWARLERRC